MKIEVVPRPKYFVNDSVSWAQLFVTGDYLAIKLIKFDTNL